MMKWTRRAVVGVGVGAMLIGWSVIASGAAAGGDAAPERGDDAVMEAAMKIEYLEVVTPTVNETCAALAAVHGVSFGEPVAALGNARTAELAGGGRIGVRAPMHGGEKAVVRPYVLVGDAAAALEKAKAAGAEVAVPPMPIPGEGTIAIYILGGIEHGVWER